MLAGDIQVKKGICDYGVIALYPSVLWWAEGCSLRRRLCCEVGRRKDGCPLQNGERFQFPEKRHKTFVKVIVVEVGEGVGMEWPKV